MSHAERTDDTTQGLHFDDIFFLVFLVHFGSLALLEQAASCKWLAFDTMQRNRCKSGTSNVQDAHWRLCKGLLLLSARKNVTSCIRNCFEVSEYAYVESCQDGKG